MPALVRKSPCGKRTALPRERSNRCSLDSLFFKIAMTTLQVSGVFTYVKQVNDVPSEASPTPTTPGDLLAFSPTYTKGDALTSTTRAGRSVLTILENGPDALFLSTSGEVDISPIENAKTTSSFNVSPGSDSWIATIGGSSKSIATSYKAGGAIGTNYPAGLMSQVVAQQLFDAGYHYDHFAVRVLAFALDLAFRTFADNTQLRVAHENATSLPLGQDVPQGAQRANHVGGFFNMPSRERDPLTDRVHCPAVYLQVGPGLNPKVLSMASALCRTGSAARTKVRGWVDKMPQINGCYFVHGHDAEVILNPVTVAEARELFPELVHLLIKHNGYPEARFRALTSALYGNLPLVDVALLILGAPLGFLAGAPVNAGVAGGGGAALHPSFAPVGALTRLPAAGTHLVISEAVSEEVRTFPPNNSHFAPVRGFSFNHPGLLRAMFEARIAMGHTLPVVPRGAFANPAPDGSLSIPARHIDPAHIWAVGTNVPASRITNAEVDDVSVVWSSWVAFDIVLLDVANLGAPPANTIAVVRPQEAIDAAIAAASDATILRLLPGADAGIVAEAAHRGLALPANHVAVPAFGVQLYAAVGVPVPVPGVSDFIILVQEALQDECLPQGMHLHSYSGGAFQVAAGGRGQAQANAGIPPGLAGLLQWVRDNRPAVYERLAEAATFDTAADNLLQSPHSVALPNTTIIATIWFLLLPFLGRCMYRGNLRPRITAARDAVIDAGLAAVDARILGIPSEYLTPLGGFRSFSQAPTIHGIGVVALMRKAPSATLAFDYRSDLARLFSANNILGSLWAHRVGAELMLSAFRPTLARSGTSAGHLSTVVGEPYTTLARAKVASPFSVMTPQDAAYLASYLLAVNAPHVNYLRHQLENDFTPRFGARRVPRANIIANRGGDQTSYYYEHVPLLLNEGGVSAYAGVSQCNFVVASGEFASNVANGTFIDGVASFVPKGAQPLQGDSLLGSTSSDAFFSCAVSGAKDTDRVHIHQFGVGSLGLNRTFARNPSITGERVLPLLPRTTTSLGVPYTLIPTIIRHDGNAGAIQAPGANPHFDVDTVSLPGDLKTYYANVFSWSERKLDLERDLYDHTKSLVAGTFYALRSFVPPPPVSTPTPLIRTALTTSIVAGKLASSASAYYESFKSASPFEAGRARLLAATSTFRTVPQNNTPTSAPPNSNGVGGSKNTSDDQRKAAGGTEMPGGANDVLLDLSAKAVELLNSMSRDELIALINARAPSGPGFQ